MNSGVWKVFFFLSCNPSSIAGLLYNFLLLLSAPPSASLKTLATISTNSRDLGPRDKGLNVGFCVFRYRNMSIRLLN